MFGYVGSSQADIGELFSALKKASKNDKNITWSKDRSHSDGWGCVILSENELTHYRNSKPVFDDNFELPEIRGQTYAVFHSRRAAGGPVGSPTFSHPFMATTDRELILLAHNGSLKTKQEGMVDSELALRKIVEKGGLSNAKSDLIDMTDTALNLLILSVDRISHKARLEYLNSWLKAGRDEYYKLYTKSLDGGIAVFSSTIKDDFEGAVVCHQRNEILTLSP